MTFISGSKFWKRVWVNKVLGIHEKFAKRSLDLLKSEWLNFNILPHVDLKMTYMCYLKFSKSIFGVKDHLALFKFCLEEKHICVIPKRTPYSIVLPCSGF